MLILQALPAAQPPSDPIVVTGRALADPAAERAFAVDSIKRDRLAASPSHRLDEILKQVPGLQLFRRTDSASGHPTSQGVTLRALGGNAASRALLVLDGVPQADPFGGWVAWPAYDPAALDEVRIMRGGGSVAHGPGSLAGVIEMRSLAATGANGSLEAGSRGSVIGRAYLGAGLGPGILAVNVQGGRSAGFVPLTRETRGPVDRPAPHRQASIRARWVVPLGRAAEMQAGALAFADERERGLPFTQNRTRGVDASVRLVGTGRLQWSAAGFVQRRNFRSSFASVEQGRTRAQRVSLQDAVPARGIGFSAEARPALATGLELRLGGDTRFTAGESRELYAYANEAPARRRAAGGKTATYGLFAEAALARGALGLSGGARIDHWRVADGELVERLIATGAASRDERYADRSGWRPTARAGAVIDLGSGVSLRSAGYLGWRMPSLNELFRPFRAGADATAANPLLEPERLAGIEAGAKLAGRTVQLSLTGFANRLSNSIANVTLGRGPGVFPGVGFVAGDYRQRLNIDGVVVHGLEASGEAGHGPFTLALGAVYNRAKVSAQGRAAALDGLRPAQTPEAVVTGELRWSAHRGSASLMVRHTGGQFEDDLNRRLLASASTIDAFAAWSVSDRWQIVGRAENLLDETVMAAISDDRTVERAAPRTLWIGLRLR